MRAIRGTARVLRARLALPRTRPDRVVERIAPVGRRDVLLVFDEPGAWTRYRCDHKGEQFGLLEASFDIAQSGRIDLVAAVDHYECFILNRVQWSDDLAAFFERARSRDRIVIFDTDDLIFEPKLHDHFAVFDGWAESERRSEIEKLDRYRKTLEACGGAIVTTEPLREHARPHTGRVEVVFNAVGEEMIRLGDEALGSVSDRRGVSIAYLSGTRTHNRDFLEAADAVLWALDNYPETRLLAVGKLELDSRFDRFGPRVERVSMQPWRALPKLLSGVDINLAPLEGNNPFTECKSCVKYLEAGLLYVPTIASPRPDFVRAIDDGRNGLLAEGPQEWRDALRRLIESPELRRDIGGLAFEDVRRNHTTRASASLLGEVLTALGTRFVRMSGRQTE
jgi:glycosyltransferase involved in cell wall biosynthesis